jgi:hypothetical protein
VCRRTIINSKIDKNLSLPHLGNKALCIHKLVAARIARRTKLLFAAILWILATSLAAQNQEKVSFSVISEVCAFIPLGRNVYTRIGYGHSIDSIKVNSTPLVGAAGII